MAILNSNNRCGQCAHYESKTLQCEPVRDYLDTLPWENIPRKMEFELSKNAMGCQHWTPQETAKEAA